MRVCVRACDVVKERETRDLRVLTDLHRLYNMTTTRIFGRWSACFSPLGRNDKNGVCTVQPRVLSSGVVSCEKGRTGVQRRLTCTRPSDINQMFMTFFIYRPLPSKYVNRLDALLLRRLIFSLKIKFVRVMTTTIFI